MNLGDQDPEGNDPMGTHVSTDEMTEDDDPDEAHKYQLKMNLRVGVGPARWGGMGDWRGRAGVPGGGRGWSSAPLGTFLAG